MLAWLLERAGTLQTLYGKGDLQDRLTPYHRLKGKPWRIPLPHFGERVEYRRRTRHKLDQRWRPGIFLGIRRSTSEKIVGDADGIFVVQSTRRQDEVARWGGTLLLSVRGTPWQSTPGRDDTELPKPIVLHPELPEVEAKPAEPFHRAVATRRLYTTRKDLDKFGYTAGCPACTCTPVDSAPQLFSPRQSAVTGWRPPSGRTP